jgi:hypothetical protein
MTFTTPCFVRVENPEKRKELIEWLEGIGYTHFPFIHDSCLIATDSDGRIWLTDANRDGAYDCQTNTDLFKALAAMNYENYREQWFVEEGKMFKCTSDKIDNYPYNWPNTRKATAEEIVEYFKNKER